jgi:hypothetical protein
VDIGISVLPDLMRVINGQGRGQTNLLV